MRYLLVLLAVAVMLIGCGSNPVETPAVDVSIRLINNAFGDHINWTVTGPDGTFIEYTLYGLPSPGRSNCHLPQNDVTILGPLQYSGDYYIIITSVDHKLTDIESNHIIWPTP